MQKYLREVEKALRPHRDPKRARQGAHIINTKLEYWGIPVPIQRRVFKHGFSFSTKSHGQQAKIWNDIWKHSNNFEVMKQPLFYFESRIKQNDLKDWRLLKTWADRLENWEHADNYCKIVSDLHERYPTKVYPTLKTWNQSKKMWTRRASIVSLFLYSAARTKQPPFQKVIALVEPLIGSDHHYLHKAVGWTLRECHNVYPKQTYQFLVDHIVDLAPCTFSYATEKIPKVKKDKLKKLRGSKT